MIENRIYGPPGTGKTTFLTNLVSKAAAKYGAGSVIVTSYTTAAAAEVAERAGEIPEDNIGTLHKFCYAAINRPPIAETKSSLLKEWNEHAPAYRMSMPGCRDINAGLEYGEHALLGDALLAHATLLRNRMIPPEQWPANVQTFHDLWTSWKIGAGCIDFTDMLDIALAQTTEAPSCPRVIFTDEAQDCTALQFAVLKKWAQTCERLVMVGDDDQCIYQFAGATPEAFAIGQPGEHDHVLSQSYRVPHAVWEKASEWISRVRDRVTKTYAPRPEPGFVHRSAATYKDGQRILAEVTKQLQTYSSVMVITSCSYMLDPIKKALTDAGVPFHNPYRLIRADWNPLKLQKGTTMAERVMAIFGPEMHDRKWWTPAEVAAFASVLKADGVFVRGMKGKVENIPTVNLDTLFEYFTPEAVNALMTNDLDWWNEHLLNHETQAKAAYPLRIAQNLSPWALDTTTNKPQVIIGTIHSVKGAEADVVIMAPDLSQQGMVEWTGAGRAAIRRVFYVGLTRARHGVILLQPASPITCDI
jgi:superfamily I DNA/RNA helicase